MDIYIFFFLNLNFFVPSSAEDFKKPLNFIILSKLMVIENYPRIFTFYKIKPLNIRFSFNNRRTTISTLSALKNITFQRTRLICSLGLETKSSVDLSFELNTTFCCSESRQIHQVKKSNLFDF